VDYFKVPFQNLSVATGENHIEDVNNSLSPRKMLILRLLNDPTDPTAHVKKYTQLKVGYNQCSGTTDYF
jgi:hypothetical protein